MHLAFGLHLPRLGPRIRQTHRYLRQSVCTWTRPSFKQTHTEMGRAEVSEIARESLSKRKPRAEPEMCIHKCTQTHPPGIWSGMQEINGKFWNTINVMVVLRPHRVQFAEAAFQSGLFITPQRPVTQS